MSKEHMDHIINGVKRIVDSVRPDIDKNTREHLNNLLQNGVPPEEALRSVIVEASIYVLRVSMIASIFTLSNEGDPPKTKDELRKILHLVATEPKEE